MEFNVSSRLPSGLHNACQLVFLFPDGKLKGAARKIDSQSGGSIKQLFQSKDFTGKCGQTLLVHNLKGASAERILLVGLGPREQLDRHKFRDAAQAACKALCATPASHAISDYLGVIAVADCDLMEMAAQLVSSLVNAAYQFSKHDRLHPREPSTLQSVTFSVEKANVDAAWSGVKYGLAIGKGMSTAKDLGNLAPNLCTPEYLALQAVSMAAAHDKLQTTVLDEEEMEALGMGAMLAVTRGSHQPGKLIIMNYQGKRKAGSPVVLVGKGVTFDTGGISIKPSEAMDEMKYDMCGAASVFGAIQAVADLDLDMNVIGIVAAVENMPGGNATRPGDVVVSMSGQSIEILNTDAEGRLVLCDALTYATRYKPSVVIDIATLTGACVVALGNVASAVMGNNQQTVDALLKSGKETGDYCWQLPIWDDYQKQLDSNFADVANIGGKAGGAITAACFLSRFADKFNWAHLDIAGTAWTSGSSKGATGRPVPLLMHYLVSRLDA
jgi:leucyl aminopeptidase